MNARSTEWAQKYREAAQLAEEIRSVACHALDQVSDQGYGRGDLYIRFAELFRPEVEVGPGWFGDVDRPQCQSHRVLSLLMMAAIAEAGDAP